MASGPQGLGACAPEGMRPPARRGLRPGGNAAAGPKGSEGPTPRREVGINEGGNGYVGGRESGFAELKRVEAPSLPLSERHDGFREVELCFSDEQVKEETHRCLQCDLEICLAQEARSE